MLPVLCDTTHVMCLPMSCDHPCDLSQDQYVFIHDAVLESLSCGDTQIVAKELVKAMKLLEQTDEHTGKTVPGTADSGGDKC